MRKITGIYVPIKGDYTQLRKDMLQAKQIITESAKGMSDALNNAFAPSKIKGSINSLVANLGTLSRSQSLVKESFQNIGVGLGGLQRITGLASGEFVKLQQRMLETQAASQQEKALKSVAVAAGLSKVEIAALGQQMGVSAAQVYTVTTAIHGAAAAMSSLSLEANAGLFAGFKGQTAAFANDLTALSNSGKVAGAAMDSLGVDMKTLQRQTGLTETEFARLQGKLLQTQATKAQERALASIAKAANLTEQEMRQLGASMNVSQATIDKTAAGMNNLGKSTEFSMTKFKDMIITVGIYTAAFTAISKLIDGLKSVITYNAQIEISQLGIASSFLTAGKYVDVYTGKVLDGAAAFKEAQSDSRDVLEELKAANLATIATLDQLVRAYQETLPVAMRAGFDKSQVQQFTTAMIQAAGAIDASGALMHQLGEETRSMLTGAINPRTSRIATVLGITNKDVAEFKGNANGMFNFLMGKLSAYQVAGVELQSTWKGVMSNMLDVAQQVAGMIGEPLFEAFKLELKEIIDSIVVMDEKTKQLKWSEDFLSGVTSIKEGVTSIIAEFYRLNMLLDKVGGTMTTIGAALTFGDMDSKFREWNDLFKKRYEEGDRKLQGLANRSIGLNTDGTGRSGGTSDKFVRNPAAPDEDGGRSLANDMNAANSAKFEYLKAAEERKLAIIKNSLDMEQQVNETAYALGIESYQKYVDTRQSIAEKSLEADLKAKQKELADAQAAAAKVAPVTDKEGKSRPDKDLKNEYDALKRVENATRAVEEAQGKLNIAREKGSAEAITTSRETLRAYKEIEIQLLESQGKTLEAAREQASLDNQSVERLRMMAAAREGDMAAQQALFALQKQQAINYRELELDKARSAGEAASSIAELTGEYEKQAAAEAKLLDIEIELAKLRGESPEHLAYLDALRQRYQDMTTEAGAFAVAWKDATKDWASSTKRMADLASDTANAMHSSFEDLFFDALQGDMKSFMDYFKGFMNSLTRALADFWAKWLIGNMTSGVSWLRAGMSAGAGAMHGGGVVGVDQPAFTRDVPLASTSGIPKFHNGLKSDEFLSILKKDEAVFTPGQLEALSQHIVGRKDNAQQSSVNQSNTINVPVAINGGEMSKRISVELKREIEDAVIRVIRGAA